jgi:hypothetical protein
MVKKKSELDLDYKPPRWKPGEAVVVLLSWDGKTYPVGGYEVFNDEKEHSLSGGFMPIKLAYSKMPRHGELLVVRKGQKGRPVRRKESEVLKLSNVPKDTIYSFEEVFGCGKDVTTVVGACVKSEQDDLNFGIAPAVEEIIEE